MALGNEKPIALEEAALAMGQTRALARRLDLSAMTPQNDLASTSFCLANPGVAYLIYQPKAGASFSVNLSPGAYGYEWIKPTQGATSEHGVIEAASGPTEFKAPFSGEAVLYLDKR